MGRIVAARATLGVLAVVAITLGAGCGDDDDGAREGVSTSTAEVPDAPEPRLELVGTSVGEVLDAGPTGHTVYVFTDDTESEVACVDSCAIAWPPVPGPIGVSDDLDEDLVGTIERPDGSTQATYAGRPVYQYSGDGADGDLTGQGAGGKWFVIDASGELVTDPPAG